MRRNQPIDEVYSAAVAEAGSFAAWDPERWLWPGAYGMWRRGVFDYEGQLDPAEWGFQVNLRPAASQDFSSDGIGSAEHSGGGAVGDPLGAITAGAQVVYSVSGQDEVLFLSAPGVWWEVEDQQALQEAVRREIASWRVGRIVVCSVLETPQAVIGISSRSTGSFTVSGSAKGPIHIGVVGKGEAKTEKRSDRHVRRLYPLRPRVEVYPPPTRGSSAEDRKLVGYTPLFGEAFRVSGNLLARMGFLKKRLVDPDGNPIYERIARAQPEDLVYDEEDADISPEEIQRMDLSEVFETVPPAQVVSERQTELETEFIDSDFPEVVLTTDLLGRFGIKQLDRVSVPRDYRSVLTEIRQQAAERENAEPETKEHAGADS